MRRRLSTVALLALLTALASVPAEAAATSPRQRARTPSADRPPAPARPQPRPTRGLETILQDDGLLLHRPQAEVEAAVARMKELGIDRVRITASWSSLTRHPESDIKPDGFDASDPGAYEQARWARLDTAIRAIRGAGLKALVDVGFWAPHWATTDPPGPRARTNIDPVAFADFAAAVALRYSGAFTPPPDPPAAPEPAPSQDASLIDGILQSLLPFPLSGPTSPRTARAAEPAADGPSQRPLPRVDRFVLWNEPNHQGLLLPQWGPDGRTPASPAVYRAMVRAGYTAIKQVRRSATVLIGNTSSTGGTRGRGAVPPLEFLRELACVDARFRPRITGDCAGYTQLPGDGWAHHPYSQNERPSRTSDPLTEPGDVRLADLPALARTLARLVAMGRLAPADGEIYLTEFGYETKGVPGRPRVSELQQARWLTWAEQLADRVPAVRSFSQFLLRDQPPAPERVSASGARPFGEYSTGLLYVDGSEKVAAATFRAGLFAQLLPKGRALLYARLRLGAGPRVIVLQRQLPGGAWQRLERLELDGRSAVTRTLVHRPGTRYRLTYPWPDGRRKTGLAVRPVPAAG